MILSIHLQGETSARTVDVADPLTTTPSFSSSLWTHIYGSLGVHAWPEIGVVRLTNGVFDPVGQPVGGAFIQSISLDGVPYMSADNFIPARGTLYMGTGVPGEPPTLPGRVCSGPVILPTTPQVIVGGIAIPLPQSHATMHQNGPLQAINQTFGLSGAGSAPAWQLSGLQDSAAPGAQDIEVVSGWQRDPAYTWLRHKGYTHRARLDCFYAESGLPAVLTGSDFAGGHHSLAVRFAHITGDPQVFHEAIPGAVPSTVVRQYLTLNTGSCDYRTAFEGRPNPTGGGNYSWSPGWHAPDGQHMIRLLHLARSLVEQYGWFPALLDIEMWAHDSKWAYSGIFNTTPGQGSIQWDRQTAWALEAFRLSVAYRDFFYDGSLDADECQMPNGQMYRGTIAQTGGAQPPPNGGPPQWPCASPILDTYDTSLTAENWFMCYALLGAGTGASDSGWDASELAMSRMEPVIEQIHYVPKWIVVAFEDDVPLTAFFPFQWNCGPDFFPWVTLGLLCCRDLARGIYPRRWLQLALQLNLPGTSGYATSLSGLYGYLSTFQDGRSQTVAMCSALERVPLP